GGFAAGPAGARIAGAGAMRDAVAAVDREQPVAYVRTLDGLIADATAAQRVSTALVTFFAVLALLLAAMGIYGVLAQTVLERRQEIGIRIALGAQRRHILRLVAGRLAVVAGLGLVLGVFASCVAGRLLAALLYGISPQDPRLLAAVTVLLAAVAVLAALIPLRRAFRTDPVAALRVD